MQENDLKALLHRLIGNLALDTGHTLTNDDMREYIRLYETYGFKILNHVLLNIIETDPKVFPPAERVELILQAMRQTNEVPASISDYN